MVRSSVPCFPETVNLSSMVRSGVPMVFGPWCLSSMVGCVFRGGRLGYIILYAQPGGSEHRLARRVLRLALEYYRARFFIFPTCE